MRNIFSVPTKIKKKNQDEKQVFWVVNLSAEEKERLAQLEQERLEALK